MPRTRKHKTPLYPICDQSASASSTPSTHHPPTNLPPCLPANWLPHLTYLTRPIYSPHLTPSELSTLHTPPSNQFLSSNSLLPVPATGPYCHISIQPITSPPTHPALNQSGLFATQPLYPGSWICDYMGYIHPFRTPNLTPALNPTAHDLAADADVNKDAVIDTATLDSCSDAVPIMLQIDMDAAATSSDYDLSLHRELGIGIDASTCGNEARFINDYRGISATPNAQFEERWVRLPPLSKGPLRDSWRQEVGGDEKRWKWELRMGVSVMGLRRDGEGVGKKGILAGDEIVVSYGKGFWRERGAEIVEECEDVGIPVSEDGEPIKKGEAVRHLQQKFIP